MAAPKPGDMSAGMIGFAVAAIFLLVVLGGIVKLTNAHYNAKEARTPAAVVK